MTFRILWSIAFLFITYKINAQQFLWSNSWGYYDLTDNLYKTSIDKLGNVYAVGNFSNTVDFDPGSQESFLTSIKETDAYVTKFDASGKFVWAKSWGSEFSDACSAIAIDSKQNVYVAGWLHSSAPTFIGSYTLTSISSFNMDSYIAKLDKEGNFLWAKKFGGQKGAFAQQVIIDSLDNIFVYGNFDGSVDFDPSNENTTITTNGISSFLTKFDSDGNFKSVKKLPFFGTSELTLDKDWNFYIIGEFEGTKDFDSSIDNFFITSKGEKDIFFSKYDSTGKLLFVKSIGGVEEEVVKSSIVDNKGRIYCLGEFKGTIDLDPGVGIYNGKTINNLYGESFIIRLDSLGNFSWGRFYGTSSISPKCISVDKNEEIYVSGYYRYKNDFDLGPQVYNLSAPLYYDVFIQKFDNEANHIWAVNLPGSTSNSYAYPNHMSIGPNNELIIGGNYQYKIDFDPSSNQSLSITTSNYWNPFIVKFSNEIITGITEEKELIIPLASVYPNPSSGAFSIEFVENRKDVKIEISDLSGNVVAVKNMGASKVCSFELKCSDGIYILKVFSEGSLLGTTKLINHY